MAHLNAWSGTVNLATEPELRQITENFNVCRFRACSTVRRKVDGSWTDKPVWLTIEVYGHDANYVARYAHKGSFMAVQGELEYHEWTGQDAQKKSELRVAVDARNGGAVNLGPKQASNGQPTPQTQVQQAPMHAPPAFPPQGVEAQAPAAPVAHGHVAQTMAAQAPAIPQGAPTPQGVAPQPQAAPGPQRQMPRQPLAAGAVPVLATAVPAGQDDIPF